MRFAAVGDCGSGERGCYGREGAVGEDGKGAGRGVGGVAAKVGDGVAGAVHVDYLVWVFGVVLWRYHFAGHGVGKAGC